MNKMKMNRDELYKELWEISATGVAKKYNLEYTRVIQACKEYNVPYPPSSHWMKVRFGKESPIIPLPSSDSPDVFIDSTLPRKREKKVDKPIVQNSVVEKEPLVVEEKPILTLKPHEETSNSSLISKEELPFLTDEEISHINEVLETIKPQKKLHEEVSVFDHINRTDYHYGKSEKYFEYVSQNSIPRVKAFLSLLIYTIEALGGSVDKKGYFYLRDQQLMINFKESQDELPHKLSKEEAKALLEYNDAVKYKSYASKPQIRKYDREYNGRITLKIADQVHFRDRKSVPLEDYFENIIIALFNESEKLRIKRAEYEEKERIRKEKEDIEKNKIDRENLEKDNVVKLLNLADDYETACKIRNYCNALEARGNLTDYDKEVLEWSYKKADWFDPTISKEDEFFGKRQHEADSETKDIFKKKQEYYRRYW